MANRSAKAPSNKSPPVTKKSNLSSKAHETLLTWLVTERQGVCNTYFGRDDEWLSKAVADAQKSFAEESVGLLAGLTSRSADESLSAEYRRIFADRLTWAKASLRKFSPPPPPDSDTANSPIIHSWAVQERIYETKDIHGRSQGKPAGFVDLSVLMGIPSSLRVECFDAELATLVRSSRGLDDDDVKRITGMQIHRPTWQVGRWNGLSYQRVWFDVWAELPAMGDLLQHLKGLSELNQAYFDHRVSNDLIRTSTVLVVPTIGDGLREIVEHEGFVVVDRTWYDAD